MLTAPPSPIPNSLLNCAASVPPDRGIIFGSAGAAARYQLSDISDQELRNYGWVDSAWIVGAKRSLLALRNLGFIRYSLAHPEEHLGQLIGCAKNRSRVCLRNIAQALRNNHVRLQFAKGPARNCQKSSKLSGVPSPEPFGNVGWYRSRCPSNLRSQPEPLISRECRRESVTSLHQVHRLLPDLQLAHGLHGGTVC